MSAQPATAVGQILLTNTVLGWVRISCHKNLAHFKHLYHSHYEVTKHQHVVTKEMLSYSKKCELPSSTFLLKDKPNFKVGLSTKNAKMLWEASKYQSDGWNICLFPGLTKQMSWILWHVLHHVSEQKLYFYSCLICRLANPIFKEKVCKQPWKKLTSSN